MLPMAAELVLAWGAMITIALLVVTRLHDDD